MADTQVLIAGAGPTGLVLALILRQAGVSVRIVDKAPEPGTTSRALAVQARTLEFYRQLGIADEVVQAGRKVPAVNLWTRGRQAAHLPIARYGAEISAFGFPLIYPQDEHERLLIARLSDLGVTVERPLDLTTFEEHADGVRATLRRADGTTETCQALYLAGCDGARSIVRGAIGAEFPGGTYEHLFYVADVEASGPALNGELHVDMEDADFLAIFPLKADGHARLIGTVRGERAQHADTLTFADVGERAMANLKVQVARVNWFSTYHVHHRVADRFRRGRALLAGDAAHIHSPVGGQGMNTGIGDAVNLAWKLAMVVKGQAGATLLDTYQPERIAFAHRLVATTDRVFTAVTASGPVARVIRTEIAPRALSVAIRLPGAPKLAFRTVSQTAIAYPDSALSESGGGERLPWVRLASGDDNHAHLQGFVWRAHVYGASPEGLDLGVPLTVFPWEEAFAAAGLRRDALYLIRPDGYVALLAPRPDAGQVGAYLERRGLNLAH